MDCFMLFMVAFSLCLCCLSCSWVCGQVDVFFSANVESNVDVLIHTMWKAGFPACKLTVRTTNPEYAQLAWQAIERALKQ